jgi:hypothetical protein
VIEVWEKIDRDMWQFYCGNYKKGLEAVKKSKGGGINKYLFINKKFFTSSGHNAISSASQLDNATVLAGVLQQLV